jgi:hypothetical protein
MYTWGIAVAQWLRCCTTNRKIAGSIPNGVTGIFHWHNSSGHTTVLELTQALTEMSTRNISWGVKLAGAYDWQPYHLHLPIVLKSGSLNLLEPSGPVQACNGISLPYIHIQGPPKGCIHSLELSPGFVMHKGIPIAIVRLRHKKL